MKISELLAKLSDHKEIEIEERRLEDATVYVFSSVLPFPKVQAVWYPIVVIHGEETHDVPRNEIEAMLRHLWMFQLDIFPEDGELTSTSLPS